jgi:HSP20 family molecular chaperone IbpA
MTRPTLQKLSSRNAVSLALATILLSASTMARAATDKDAKPSGSFVEKMKQWEDRMSDSFRDAWEGWRGKKADQSLAAASVDLREQRDSYMVRLSLPNRDVNAVQVTLDGDTLHIVAPAEKQSSRYEQSIALPQVKLGAQVQIDRRPKDHLLVITAPKDTDVASNDRWPHVPDPALAPLSDWDRDILRRLENSRREMDRIFDQSSEEFRLMPGHKGVFDHSRFGSSIDLQEEGNNYVVRAYLPDRDIKNVDVNVTGQVLKIEAKAEGTPNKKEDASKGITHQADYLQEITLPGPVKSDKMEVNREVDMLVVTLPKA